MSLARNRCGIGRFDRWARTYDQGRIKFWLARAQARALEGVGLEADDVLLDVGCGTGDAVFQAARRPIRRACGVDLSAVMIERARRNAGGFDNVEFRIADAEAIPYGDGEFTAVICTNSLHHYSDPRQALGEMRRVLRPRGRVLLVDPDRAGCRWVWCWDRILRVAERGHVRYYTVSEIGRLLGEAGFTDITLVAAEHGHFRHGKIAWASATFRAGKR